jgi:hypothetical protein
VSGVKERRHLKLVISKPTDWQPPCRKASSAAKTRALAYVPIFNNRDFYYAAIGSAMVTTILFAMLIGIYCVSRMTQP